MSVNYIVGYKGTTWNIFLHIRGHVQQSYEQKYVGAWAEATHTKHVPLKPVSQQK